MTPTPIRSSYSESELASLAIDPRSVVPGGRTPGASQTMIEEHRLHDYVFVPVDLRGAGATPPHRGDLGGDGAPTRPGDASTLS